MDSIHKLPREDFEHRYNDLLTLHKQLSQKYSEKDTKGKEQDSAIRELETKLAAAEKWARSAKEVVKQEQSLRSNCEAEVAKLKEEVDQYKDQIAKLTKNTSYQESAKHIFAGSEQ
jgi:chromosome segregation ATPase